MDVVEMRVLVGSPLHEAEALTELVRTRVVDIRNLLHPRRSLNPLMRIYQRFRYGREKQVSLAAVLLPYVSYLPAPKLRAEPGAGIKEVAERAQSQVLTASALVDLRRTTEPDLARVVHDGVGDLRQLVTAEQRLRQAEEGRVGAAVLNDQAIELDQLVAALERAAEPRLMTF